MRETAAGNAEEVHRAVATLLTLPLPAQAKWAVLQGALQHKVPHLPRVARMALMGKAVTDTADAVADAALATGNWQLPGAEELRRRQARARSWGSPCVTAARGSTACPPLKVTLHSCNLPPLPMWQWSAPQSSSGPLMGPPAQASARNGPSSAPMLGSPTPAGTWLMMLACARSCRQPRHTPQEPSPPAAYGQLLHSTTGAAREKVKRAQQHKARLLICAYLASSIWLTALPIHNTLTLSKSVFCNVFQFRLGLSSRPMHAPRVRCGCGALVDPSPGSSDRTSFSTFKVPPARRCTVYATKYSLCNLVPGHAICWGAHLT